MSKHFETTWYYMSHKESYFATSRPGHPTPPTRFPWTSPNVEFFFEVGQLSQPVEAETLWNSALSRCNFSCTVHFPWVSYLVAILKPISDPYTETTETTETLLVRLAEATAPRNQGCVWYPLVPSANRISPFILCFNMFCFTSWFLPPKNWARVWKTLRLSFSSSFKILLCSTCSLSASIWPMQVCPADAFRSSKTVVQLLWHRLVEVVASIVKHPLCSNSIENSHMFQSNFRIGFRANLICTPCLPKMHWLVTRSCPKHASDFCRKR